MMRKKEERDYVIKFHERQTSPAGLGLHMSRKVKKPKKGKQTIEASSRKEALEIFRLYYNRPQMKVVDSAKWKKKR